jgi:hypothetical protein
MTGINQTDASKGCLLGCLVVVSIQLGLLFLSVRGHIWKIRFVFLHDRTQAQRDVGPNHAYVLGVPLTG